MKTKILVSALAAAFLAAGSATAFADDRGHGRKVQKQQVDKHYRHDARAHGPSNDHRHRQGGHRDVHRAQQHRHVDSHRHADRHRPVVRHAAPVHVHVHNHGRGAGPRRDVHRGRHLPVHYHSRQYVVENWRGYRLSAPPHGHHWVQVGADYALVAIASGLIAQIVLSN